MNWGVEEMLRVAARMANEHGCEVRVDRQGDFCVRPLGNAGSRPGPAGTTSTERVRRHRLARKQAAQETAVSDAENQQCKIMSADAMEPSGTGTEGPAAPQPPARVAGAGEAAEAPVSKDAEPGLALPLPALQGALTEAEKTVRERTATAPGDADADAAACAPHGVLAVEPGLSAGAETAPPQGDETRGTFPVVSPGDGRAGAPSFPPSPPSPSPPSSTPAHTPVPPPAREPRRRRKRRKGATALEGKAEAEAEAANAEPLPAVLDTAAFRAVWVQWCQRRSLLAAMNPGKIWNPAAARQTLEECLLHGEETALVALRSALANSWQGLVWERALAQRKASLKAERQTQGGGRHREPPRSRSCDGPRPRHRAYQAAEATRGLTPAQISGF